MSNPRSGKLGTLIKDDDDETKYIKNGQTKNRCVVPVTRPNLNACFYVNITTFFPRTWFRTFILKIS